jgi:hypothetical protein
MKNPRIAAGVLVFRCNLPEVRSPDAFPFTELSISLLISVSPVVSQVPEVFPFGGICTVSSGWPVALTDI